MLLLAQLLVPIENLVRIEGRAQIGLVGYGLVVGLPGTGDSRKIAITKQLLRSALSSLDFVPEKDFESKNVAAVMITATVPAGARPGSKIDVQVSSIGDARSIDGGVLLPSPLKAGDGKIYAVAQGRVVAGKKSPTGKIPAGAVVTAELKLGGESALVLRNPSYQLAQQIASAINNVYPGAAIVKDAFVVNLNIPAGVGKAEFMAEILKLKVKVPPSSRVVIDSRTGVIVMGGDVKITKAAIFASGLKVECGFSMEDSATVDDVVSVLNQMGATPKMLVSVLQGLYRAGALQGELEVW